MESWDKARYISRIISGQQYIKIKDDVFIVKTPTRLQRYLADSIFLEQLIEAREVGAWDEADLRAFMINNGMWSDEDDKTLKILENDIQNFKKQLFINRIKTVEQVTIRKALSIAKSELLRLNLILHSYDHMTALGIANSAKQRYLLGCSVFYKNGAPYWEDESSWESPDPFLDKIMLRINIERLDDSVLREISRTEPWLTTWQIQKYCDKPIFDISASDLNDEQKSLVIWSAIYENAREHSDNLDDDVLNDDDIFDGWMLVKRAEKEKQSMKSAVENVTQNSKIKNAGEQFIFVKNEKEAKNVMGANDGDAAYNLHNRFAAIKKHGEISEAKLPDTALKIRQMATEAFIKTTKGK